MTASESLARRSLVILACLAAATGSGCTSVISSAYLRDAFWDSAEHAAQTEEEAAGREDVDEVALAAADDDRRAAAIEEAVSRLSRLGALDAATRTTLVETLQRTAQEDWPAVVDVFAESLGAASTSQPLDTAQAPGAEDQPLAPGSDVTAAAPPEPHVVAKADLDAALLEEPTAAGPDAASATDFAAASEHELEEAMAPPQGPPEPTQVPPEPEPAEPDAATAATVDSERPPAALTIHNACFASRVQAWGVVDRFATDRFRPGQDVIVYFELDGLTAGRSPAGHTTCIDTTLQLKAADGTLVHDWSFEPIAETCRARRHDYFARYVVRIPEQSVAADCRLEITVTDTLSGVRAEAALPLTIAAAAP